MKTELDEYEHIWTNERDIHWLVKLSNKDSYVIIVVMPNSMGGLIIEDDEIYIQVITKMIENGNKRITETEFHNLISKRSKHG